MFSWAETGSDFQIGNQSQISFFWRMGPYNQIPGCICVWNWNCDRSNLFFRTGTNVCGGGSLLVWVREEKWFSSENFCAELIVKIELLRVENYT